MDSPKEQDSAYSSPKSLDYSSISLPSLPKTLTNHCLRTVSSIACPSCNSTFVNPKVLPCLHSFCAPCLEINNKICPECNADYTMPPNGTSGLIPDYGIINFINSLRGSLYCNACVYEKTQAVAKCINCENFLCQNCMLAHGFIHGYDSHHVIEFPKEFFPDENTVGKEEVLCLIHGNEPVKLFCVKCNYPICQLCSGLEHSSHSVEPLDRVGEILLASMKNSIDETKKTKINELQMSLKYGSYSFWWLNSQYNDIYNKINDLYNQYCAQLLKYRDTQMQILESAFTKMKSALSSNNSAIQDSLDDFNKYNDFFAHLTKYSTTSQCLMFRKLLESKQHKICDFRPKTLRCDLKFISVGQDFGTLLFNNFGHIVHDMSTEEASDFKMGSSNALSKHSVNQSYQLKYDKWSNSALEDLKSMSDLYLSDDALTICRPFSSIRSSISRSVITYNWKFGSYGTSQGQFTEPNGVCVNAEGDIIIADTNNNRVQVFDKLGRFKFSFGENNTTTGECSTSNTLLFPNRVAVMEVTGDIIVTERAPTHQVQVYNQYGGFLRKFGANILQHPRAVAVDKEGHIIVVECKVMRVIIFDINGTTLHKFTCYGTLHFPNGVAVNDRHEIFISDNRTHCVNVYDYNGSFLRQIGREGLTNYPIGVMLSKEGLVIVADNHNNFNLTVFTQDGQLVTAVESKAKHAQCYDAAISSEGAVVLTSKDYRVYIYLTSF